MFVFARRNLVPDGLIGSGFATSTEGALLLEGDWSEEEDSAASENQARCLSLDSLIESPRFAYLDRDAEELAAEIARAAQGDATRGTPQPNFADINALRLRYEVLRWLRVVAFRRRCREGRACEDVELYVEPGRDNEYVVLWQAMARAFGFSLRIHFVIGRASASKQFVLPKNAWWRRMLARYFANRAANRNRDLPGASAHRPRVLFVGNPRILDPVCDEVLDRGADAAWLYDRFAVGAWYKRMSDGVEWLTCDCNRNVGDGFSAKHLRTAIAYDGVDLTEVVEAWARRWRGRLGAAQSRQWRSVGEHLDAFRPNRIVLDEDATPLARIVIAHAARLGIPTSVVQHGVCCVRFGFAPLAADMFCAWDEATRRQLTAWNVPPEKIVVTGSSRGRTSIPPMPVRDQGVRVVLLATLPPRDDRPDAVELHLTSRTYAAMLRSAFAAVEELRNDGYGDVELIVKMHPRAPSDGVLMRSLHEFSSLRHRIVVGGPLGDVLRGADCVLSCVSSAGIEAAAAGLPVVQLIPQGAGEILPAEWYGLLGSAATREQLLPLLRQALLQSRANSRASAVQTDPGGAARIADVLLEKSCKSHSAVAGLAASPHYARSHSPHHAEEAAHG